MLHNMFWYVSPLMSKSIKYVVALALLMTPSESTEANKSRCSPVSNAVKSTQVKPANI